MWAEVWISGCFSEPAHAASLQDSPFISTMISPTHKLASSASLNPFTCRYRDGVRKWTDILLNVECCICSFVLCVCVAGQSLFAATLVRGGGTMEVQSGLPSCHQGKRSRKQSKLSKSDKWVWYNAHIAKSVVKAVERLCTCEIWSLHPRTASTQKIVSLSVSRLTGIHLNNKARGGVVN